MISLRTFLVRLLVLCLASADFGIVGWLIPSKEGMPFDIAALVFAVITTCFAIWVTARVIPATSRVAVFAWLTIVLFVSAICHPVFESARTAAEKGGCIENLRQLSRGVLAY